MAGGEGSFENPRGSASDIVIKQKTPGESPGVFWFSAQRESRGIRELELEVRRRLPGCRDPVEASPDTLVTDDTGGAEIRSPRILERRAQLERVARDAVLATTLSDDFQSDPCRMLNRVPEWDRSAAASPKVAAAEVVVGEELCVQRAVAGSVVVRPKTSRHSVAATAFSSSNRNDGVVNPGITNAERYTARAAGICQSD